MENELLKGLYDCFYTPRSFPNRNYMNASTLRRSFRPPGKK